MQPADRGKVCEFACAQACGAVRSILDRPGWKKVGVRSGAIGGREFGAIFSEGRPCPGGRSGRCGCGQGQTGRCGGAWQDTTPGQGTRLGVAVRAAKEHKPALPAIKQGNKRRGAAISPGGVGLPAVNTAIVPMVAAPCATGIAAAGRDAILVVPTAPSSPPGRWRWWRWRRVITGRWAIGHAAAETVGPVESGRALGKGTCLRQQDSEEGEKDGQHDELFAQAHGGLLFLSRLSW